MMAITTCLPTYPFVIFGILEPLLLIWAYIAAHSDLEKFYQDQSPAPLPDDTSSSSSSSPLSFPPQARVLVLTLSNIYLLLAGLALVCTCTRHASVARAYLAVVALADLGHIYAARAGLGPDIFWDTGRWNEMLWGSVGASAFLHVHRVATVLGVFGKVEDVRGKGKGKGTEKGE